MLGGYNVKPLIDALSNENKQIAQTACDVLKKIVLVYDAFNDVEVLSKTNKYAKEVLQSWADAQWFTSKPTIDEKITVAVLKVPGETNTDDLSPASEAFTRSDIPLHANAMLVSRLAGSIEKIQEIKAKGYEVA
jgi:aconitate hydratase 2/2-methylisocitrate dehydratase